MRKSEEMSDPNSCLNRAADNEMIFVLLAHDIASPETIRNWCGRRLLLGKNLPGDEQILEAWNCARTMEAQCAELRLSGKIT